MTREPDDRDDDDDDALPPLGYPLPRLLPLATTLGVGALIWGALFAWIVLA